MQLESCNFEKLVKKEENVKFSEKVDIINGNIDKINTKEKKKNEDSNQIDRLSFGILTNFRLKTILSTINNHIKNEKIDLHSLIEKYDKNSTGLIKNKEINEFFKSLNIKTLNMDDFNFMKKFLDKDENNYIKYKKFIDIIKD